VVRLEENTLPVVVLGVLCDFFFCISCRNRQPWLLAGWGFSFRQPAVAACWCGRCIPFPGALLVQVTAPASQAAGRLLAVCPDVAELLAVITLNWVWLWVWVLYYDRRSVGQSVLE
jgi:hypothetical protein